MRYEAKRIRHLRDEAEARCNNLLSSLSLTPTYHDETIMVDGSKIRLAVDDFKSILSEIRRLK